MTRGLRSKVLYFLVISYAVTAFIKVGAVYRISNGAGTKPASTRLHALLNNDNAATFSTTATSDFENDTLQVVSSDLPKSTNIKSAFDIEYLKPRLLLVICSILYGSNYVVSILLQKHLSPSIVTFFRFLISLSLFLPVILRRKSSWNVVLSGARIGMWAGLGFMTQAVSLQFTSASKASFFAGLSVLFVPLLDALRGQGFDKSQFLPALLAFSGVAFLELGGIEPPHWKDIFLALPPLSFAISFREAAKAARKYPKDSKLVVVGSLILITFQSLVWALVDGSFPLTLTSLKTIVNTVCGNKWVLLGLLYLGIVVTSWATYVEQKAMQVVSAADTTLIYTLEPLTASAFAALILNEHLTTSTAIGAICIISACLQNTFGFIRLGSFINSIKRHLTTIRNVGKSSSHQI